MSSDCDISPGIWNPNFVQGGTFNPPMQIAVNGVVGYDPLDSFFGWITSQPESPQFLVEYSFTFSDPGNGILIPLLTPAKTISLPAELLYHSFEWHRNAEGDVIPIIVGRPNVIARPYKP